MLAILLQVTQSAAPNDQPAPLVIPTYYPNGTSFVEHISGALHDSAFRVIALLTSILPGLLALIFAVAVLTGIGMFASWLLRKILVAAKFDDRLSSTGTGTNLSDFSPAHSPTALVGRTAFWAFVLLGFIIGISAFDASYASSSAVSFSLLPYLAHSVGAAIILITGNLIARFMARSVLIGAVNLQLHYARFLSLGIKWLVLVLTAAMTLDHLQIGGSIVGLAFGILFGGIVLTLALAIGLGSRDLVSRSLEKTGPPANLVPETLTDPTPIRKTADNLRHF